MGQCLTGTASLGTWRKIASGSATVNATTDMTVTTQTRNASEIVLAENWLQANVAGIDFSTGSLDNIVMWLNRTTNANEFNLHIHNLTATQRVIEWVLWGKVPP